MELLPSHASTVVRGHHARSRCRLLQGHLSALLAFLPSLVRRCRQRAMSLRQNLLIERPDRRITSVTHNVLAVLTAALTYILRFRPAQRQGTISVLPETTLNSHHEPHSHKSNQQTPIILRVKPAHSKHSYRKYLKSSTHNQPEHDYSLGSAQNIAPMPQT